MTPEELRERITAWAVDVGYLIRPLFRSFETRNRASQLKRAADSTASNYRAACIARSHKEFLSKLSIALEEADEAVGWLEMSHRDGSLRGAGTVRLLDEGRQIARILAASRNTAQAREDVSRKRRRNDAMPQ
ncbi:MAG TPA: four helix bundle protein [Vicinamibacterales bacterium]|nr:four helix bundle protein [Vicinamibacterales bacterium]